MTETLDHHDSLGVFLKRFAAFMGKAGFGLFVVAAVGIALVATTFIGLMLALAAAFLTFTYQLGRGGRSSKPQGDPNTLEAHPTPDGWVIESKNAIWR
jgi:uncharacterized RDD family membrane protein YckC